MATRLQFTPTRHDRTSENALRDRAEEVAAYQLEQAQAADAAWRARRTTRYQRRIDRAHAWEREGRRWVHTPEENVGYALMWTAVGGAPLALGNTDLRLFLFLGVMFGVLILLRPALGACLYGSARLGRRFWLRSARRANVEVTDPGNIPLFGPDLPDAPKTPE